MNATKRTIGVASLLLAAGTCLAGDTVDGLITIFGERYEVQRFDYATSGIEAENVYTPVPGPASALIESEAIAYIGNDRIVISSEDMDNYFNFPNTVILECEILYETPGDPSSPVIGFNTIRTAVHAPEDPLLAPADGILAWDLGGPSGLSLNTSNAGLGAGGNLVVGSGSERIFAFDFSIDFNDTPLAVTMGQDCSITPRDCSLLTEGGLVENTDNEDMVWVPNQTDPVNGLGWFYTVNQDADAALNIPFRVTVFDADGVPQFDFPVADGMDVQGEPKGITFWPNVASNPFGQPVVVVSLDDLGPALEVYALDGTFLATEDLFTRTPAVPGSGGPGADDCLNAESITGFGELVFTWDNTGATTDGDTDILGCERTEKDVWFNWQSPATARVTLAGDVDTLASDVGYVATVQVFDTTACPPSEVARLDCDDSDTDLDVSWIAFENAQYLIRFGSRKDECPPDFGGIGACCLPDTTCTEATSAECGDLGGTYFGDGTACASTDCTVDVPCDPTDVPAGSGSFGIFSDNPLPAFDFTGCDRSLQIESLAVQPETGRIFLNQQGDVFDCNFLFVLTPVDCPCEFDGDASEVSVTDLLAFLAVWFQNAPDGDLNGDGSVSVVDLLDFLSCWFPVSSGSDC